jgi:cytochrome c oxidase subunit 4
MAHNHPPGERSLAHIVPRRTFYLVYLALIVLTVTTTGVAYLDLGPFNIVVALAIAFTKATLVVLFFMHVRFVDNVTKGFVLGGVLWLLILIVLTMNDYVTRGWMLNNRLR